VPDVVQFVFLVERVEVYWRYILPNFVRLISNSHNTFDRPLARFDPVISQDFSEECDGSSMVCVVEEMLPDDRMHPERALFD